MTLKYRALCLLKNARRWVKDYEKIAANTKLQNEIRQRKKLEHEILRVGEREQRRIGQDLHDTLCQELTAAAFLLQSMANRAAADARQTALFSEEHVCGRNPRKSE